MPDLLHESVIINRLSFFVKYNKYFDEIGIVQNNKANTRILECMLIIYLLI